MPPEKPKPGSPQDWMRHARSDLELARVSPPPEVMWEDLCFHAQRAAEKAVKAVLVSVGVPFPKTHSIRMLLDLLPSGIPTSERLEEASLLTIYAVMGRYPVDTEPVDEEGYGEAIRLAEDVVARADGAIRGRHGHDIGGG